MSRTTSTTTTQTIVGFDVSLGRAGGPARWRGREFPRQNLRLLQSTISALLKCLFCRVPFLSSTGSAYWSGLHRAESTDDILISLGLRVVLTKDQPTDHEQKLKQRWPSELKIRTHKNKYRPCSEAGISLFTRGLWGSTHSRTNMHASPHVSPLATMFTMAVLEPKYSHTVKGTCWPCIYRYSSAARSPEDRPKLQRNRPAASA